MSPENTKNKIVPKARSPLRYPGGKSKALKKILPYIPLNIDEYREPFVGGGSVFLSTKESFGDRIKRYRIADLNLDLCCFWEYAQNEIETLVDEVEYIHQNHSDGRELYKHLTRKDLSLDRLERAVRFFVLNRITFSGTVDSGGYSQQAFDKRFTDSSIERLLDVSAHLASVEITCSTYENLLFQTGENVFIYLDPPYLSATKSRLYGLNGDLHTAFNHDQFATNMKECPHKWLITYDDCPQIRKLFDFANITEWTLQYGMNNCKQKNADRGQELMIKNY